MRYTPRQSAEMRAYMRSCFENSPIYKQTSELQDNTFALVRQFLSDGPHDVLKVNIVFLPKEKVEGQDALPPVLHYNRTDTVLDVQLERFDSWRTRLYHELHRLFPRVTWTRETKSIIHGRLNNK